jgi:UDP-N-acetylglucosamine:LPS N-acetylglucosamine transferase
VPDAGFPFVPVRVTAAQARVSFATVRAAAYALRGSRSVSPLVRGADVVVSIGGFASGPAALAARRTRRPLVLIEPNSVPGIVNRLAARVGRGGRHDVRGHRGAAAQRDVRVERTGNPIRTRSRRSRSGGSGCEQRRARRSGSSPIARRCSCSAAAKARCTSIRCSPACSRRSPAVVISSCW